MKIICDRLLKSKNVDSAAWDAIQTVWEILNGNGRDTADGMSEDESEIDEETGQKVVRILRRPWLNNAIPTLMHAVDSYNGCLLDELACLHQGNTSFKREELGTHNDRRPYMVGLPRNFYDNDWYKNLDDIEKEIVCANEKFVAIPALVSLIPICLSIHLTSPLRLHTSVARCECQKSLLFISVLYIFNVSSCTFIVLTKSVYILI